MSRNVKTVFRHHTDFHTAVPIVFFSAVIVEKIEEISTKDLEELEEVLEKISEEKLSKKAESKDLKELEEDVEAYKDVSGNVLLTFQKCVQCQKVLCSNNI